MLDQHTISEYIPGSILVVLAFSLGSFITSRAIPEKQPPDALIDTDASVGPVPSDLPTGGSTDPRQQGNSQLS